MCGALMTSTLVSVALLLALQQGAQLVAALLNLHCSADMESGLQAQPAPGCKDST